MTDRPENTTPGGIVLPNESDQEPQRLPTPEETQKEVDAIEEDRNVQAAAALKELATRIIEVVTEVDHNYNLANYLKHLTVRCNGPGDFNLDLEDKNSEVDPQAIAVEVANELAHRGGDYGKNLRPIQMEMRNVGRPAERPDADPAD